MRRKTDNWMRAMFCFEVSGPELMISLLDVKLKEDLTILSRTINIANLEMTSKEKATRG